MHVLNVASNVLEKQGDTLNLESVYINVPSAKLILNNLLQDAFQMTVILFQIRGTDMMIPNGRGGNMDHILLECECTCILGAWMN